MEVEKIAGESVDRGHETSGAAYRGDVFAILGAREL